MKRNTLIIGSLVLIGIAAYAAMHFQNSGTSQIVPAVSEGPGKNGQQIAQFKDAALGLDFLYRISPDGYVVVDPGVSEKTADAPLKILTLFKKADYEQLLRDVDAGVVREGPENINIQVFNPGPNITPNEWVAQHPNRSNFEAGTPLTWSTIDGNAAARYSWAGLFQGQTVVIARKGWVYMFTVSYSDSGMLKDFNELLSTVKLQR